MSEEKKRIHFVGVGGSSMSGLAQLMKRKGHEVTGSDRTRSHKTDALESMGIPVTIGHTEKSVAGADLLVYSAAIKPETPERREARRLNIVEMERADFLGRLMTAYGTNICISGTHGKTTTTSMVSQIFSEAGMNPTVHIGGELDALGGGTVLGGDEFFVVEADEFHGTFLKFRPDVAVILNIDADHLDFYKDIDDIEAAFLRFASMIPEDGWCLGWGDDERVRRVLSKLKCKTRTFGLEPHNELRAEDVSYDEGGYPYFRVTLFGHQLLETELKVAGEHNLVDALAAISVAEALSLPMYSVEDTMSRFTGAHRRFELTSVTDGVRVYQDYGHNPAEMRSALSIAALQKRGRLWAVWQPHTYSRTKALFDGFMETFGQADTVLVTDICGARESDPGDINSKMLVDALVGRGVDAVLTPSFDDAEEYLRANWREGDLVVTQGCGDIDLLNEQIREHGDTK